MTLSITDRIGPLYPIKAQDRKEDCGMFSFDRPSYIVWNAVAETMHKLGHSEAEIKDWLQSKAARWAADGELGQMLATTAAAFVEKCISPPPPKTKPKPPTKGIPK